MGEYLFTRNSVTKKIVANVECRFCGNKFETIEESNSDIILQRINMAGGREESVSLIATAKCNICRFKMEYIGDMKI